MSQHSAPSPDFSRYVALGDSITSGYADGALYYQGQQQAYANILAAQLNPGGRFSQPLMDRDTVGVDLLGHARLALRRGENGVPSLGHLAPLGDVHALMENNYAKEGPYQNIGVPGAKATTAVAPGFGNPLNGPGNYNPFFTRMASDPVSASMLSDTLKAQPTFFTVFLGNNDALAYALSGGTENAMSALEGPAGQGFEESLNMIVTALTATGAKGAMANLSSISRVPYFTTIPYNGLQLTAAEAAELEQLYKPSGFKFHEGKNTFVINDFITKPGILRRAQEGELILLDVLLDRNKMNYLQGKEPIPKNYTLTPEQVARVEQTIDAYNAVIKAIALREHLALVDIHRLVKSARPDRVYDAAVHNLRYHKKGVFSLDGLHPNAFGQALLANEFIRAINAHYHTVVPLIQSSSYKGISLE